jgi:hypothetical protein
LTGDTVGLLGEKGAFFAHIDGKDRASWKRIAFPGAVETSGNSVAERNVIGVYVTQEGKIRGYTAEID